MKEETFVTWHLKCTMLSQTQVSPTKPAPFFNIGNIIQKCKMDATQVHGKYTREHPKGGKEYYKKNTELSSQINIINKS